LELIIGLYSSTQILYFPHIVELLLDLQFIMQISES